MWPDTSAFRQLLEKNYDRKEMPVLALCTADIHSPFAASCAAIALQQRLLPFTHYVSVVYDFRPNIFDKSLYVWIYMNVSPIRLNCCFQFIRLADPVDRQIHWYEALVPLHIPCWLLPAAASQATRSTSVAFHSATTWRS
jgi:hypothetical protein